MCDQYTSNDGNAEARRRAVQTIHDVLASVERTDPVGAARGRHALRELAPALPGRPPKLGVGGWNHQHVLARKVRGILSARHKDDPQSVTEVGDRILALAYRLVRPRVLADADKTRLLRLVPKRKPSEIIRVLLSLRFNLPDHTIRDLQKQSNIAKVRWG